MAEVSGMRGNSGVCVRVCPGHPLWFHLELSQAAWLNLRVKSSRSEEDAHVCGETASCTDAREYTTSRLLMDGTLKSKVCVDRAGEGAVTRLMSGSFTSSAREADEFNPGVKVCMKERRERQGGENARHRER